VLYISNPMSETPASEGLTASSSALSASIVDEADFWSKFFPHENSVRWSDFAVYLLMEYSKGIRNLTSSLAPALGGHFDFDNDGIVSRKEYNRFLRTYGELGLEHGLQQAVDSALDNNWRRDPLDRRQRESRACAVELSSADGTHIELEASSDMQFGGAKPFFIEAWIRPRSSPTFGGTIFSKYNRGRKGQYFISLESNGGIFFHREVAPWGLRSNVRVPPDVFSHIAVGYGGGRSKIYINGTLRGSQREGAQAVDSDTNVLVGAIHDQDRAGSIFDGAIDELRVWGVDRTQVELEGNMHTTLTGLEYGLVGYWTFDECAGGRLRDRMGRHDGVLHGGRWLRSPVAMRTNQEIVQCPTKGKCSIDEVEQRHGTGNAYVDEMMVQNDYWKRAIKIMESQNKVNKKIIRELLMTVDTLANRMKWLEQQDRIRHSQITELHTRNVDISEAIARIRQNYSSHVMEAEEVCLREANASQTKNAALSNLMAQLANLSDDMTAPLASALPTKHLTPHTGGAKRVGVKKSDKLYSTPDVESSLSPDGPISASVPEGAQPGPSRHGPSSSSNRHPEQQRESDVGVAELLAHKDELAAANNELFEIIGFPVSPDGGTVPRAPKASKKAPKGALVLDAAPHEGGEASGALSQGSQLSTRSNPDSEPRLEPSSSSSETLLLPQAPVNDAQTPYVESLDMNEDRPIKKRKKKLRYNEPDPV